MEGAVGRNPVELDKMEFLPAAPAASSMFHGRPLALADDREPGGIDDEMDGAVGRNAVELDREVLASTRERGVVGRFEVDTHQGQDRPREALRLA